MTWQDLFLWWNAIYSVPLIFALVYFGVSLLLGGVLGGHESDHDAGVDHDVDAEADVDHDIDHDVDHDVDQDVDQDSDDHVAIAAHGQHDGAGVFSLLAFVGAGRAPLSLVIQCLLLSWGVFGLVLNGLTGGGSPAWLILSVPVSLLGSVVLTRSLAWAFWRAFRRNQTFVQSRSEFVGQTGKAVFPVTTEEGTIHFRDSSGTLHRARARTERDSVGSGQDVIIVGYDPASNVYVVDDAERFVHRSG